MTNAPSRRGSVLSLAIAATSIIIVGVVAVSSLSPSPSPTKPAVSLRPDLLDLPPTNGELAVVLHTVGLDAGTLAGAGVTAVETTTLVGTMRSYLANHMDPLRNADNSCGSARVTYDTLLRTVQAGLATENDLTAWSSAPGTLTTAISSRQTLRDAAFAAATDGLSGAKVIAITTARTNHAAWDIRLQYLFTNRQEASWVTLRDALSNQRIAVKHGEAADPAALAIIAAADAQPATALAQANLQANLAEVTAAWNAAVFPQ